MKHLYKKNKTRDELIRKDRLVKFLCQRFVHPLLQFPSLPTRSRSSVDLPEITHPHTGSDEVPLSSATNEVTAATLLQKIKDMVDAKEDVEDNTTHTSARASPFQRTVDWTFENMRMLIGSDLPIFGDEQHPAVSLRLRYHPLAHDSMISTRLRSSREMDKPINVLTGIDCWLDNLMCNVPELAMCYHVDGIVQSYETVKTEDIPYREGCEFHPNVIRDLATNLLSFLKANATKEGHTYWLFKGTNALISSHIRTSFIAQDPTTTS